MSIEKDQTIETEIARIDAIIDIADRETRNKEWKKYQAHFAVLPESLRPLVAYEICKREQSRGISGFHGWNGFEYDPISFCGWADYGDGLFDQGVGFRINRACFGDRDVELYYTDGDMLEDIAPARKDAWREKWLLGMLETMKASSSGLEDVRLHQEIEENDFLFRGNWVEPCKIKSFRFRLSASRIRETISLSGKMCPTSALGGYVLVLPRAGEFFCELGEIIDGKRVPLHIDDFCMK